MKSLLILFFTLFSFLGFAQDLTEVQKQQLDVNYLVNGGFENGKSGWSTYNDGASATPVDGVGGTANITLTTTTTLPHDGKVSGALTKDAVNRQGQGIKRDFSIPDVAKGKVVRLNFSYEITSGTYTSGDTSVWIYDVTNSRLIQPSAYTIENSGLKESKFVEFQSSIDSNSYRLIVHVTSTSASAYTLKFDSFSIGLTPKIFGSVATDWVSYTPTLSGFAVASSSFKWKKDGDSILIEVGMKLNSVSASTASFTLPSGLSVNGTKQGDVNSGVAAVGEWNSSSGGGSQGLYSSNVSGLAFTDIGDPTKVFFSLLNNTDASNNVVLGKANGSTLWGASSNVYVRQIRIPIAGWSSSQQLSNEADTRVVALIAGGNPANTSANGVIIYPTVTRDTHGGYNASTGEYTVKVGGYYRVSASLYGSFTTGILLTAVNGSARFPAMGFNFSDGRSSGSTVVFCNAGDKITVYNTVALSSLSTYNGLTIEKVSGPSQIASSESILVRATQSSGQSIASTGVGVDLTWNNVTYDSHGSFNGATGEFTAPISGKYKVTSRIRYATNTWTATNEASLVISKGGSTYSVFGDTRAWTTLSVEMNVVGADTISLLAGEKIKIQTISTRSGGSTSLSANGTVNFLNIERVGNY